MVVALVIAVIAEVVLQRRAETETTRLRWLNNISLTLINQASVNVLSLTVTIMIAWWGTEDEIGLLRHSGVGFWPILLLAVVTVRANFLLVPPGAARFPDTMADPCGAPFGH